MDQLTKASDYCDLFLALTEQRDQSSLNETLLATCLVLFPDHRFWLYDYRDLDHTTAKLIHSGIANSDTAPSNEDLYKIMQVAAERGQTHGVVGNYHYYSYNVLHSLSGLLITDMTLVNDLQLEIITKLVKVYSNQRFFMFSALNDALTGLNNRQAFDQQISKLLLDQKNPHRRSSDQEQKNWCFALLDIDYFKQVNDDYGHLFGDEVLLIFSRLMQSTFRDGDLLFRYGGEEFAVALRDISLSSAINVLNRFREKIAVAEFPQLGQVTVSIGVTSMEDDLSLPVLIDRADQALYFAKEHGRNQVHSFEALSRSGYVSLSHTHEGDIELF